MAEQRNRREVVSIGKWKPYDHPEHGAGAIREIRYIDGTIERRFAFHGTVPEGEMPETGYLVDSKVDPELRAEWDRNNPKPEAPNQRPTTGRVEGTPLPGGGFDNTKPIWVERDASGQQVGPAKPLTKEQRDQWEREKNRAAGLGDKTDAELRAEQETAETRQPVTTHPGYTQVTTKKGGKTETYYLDPNGNRVNSLPEKPTTAALVGQPTGNTRERYEGGRKIKEVEYVRPDGTKEWRAQESAADPKDEYVPEPEGAPAFADVYGQVASGLKTYSAWLDQQVALYKQTNGKQGIAPDRATKLMARRIDLAERALKEQADIVNTQVGQRKDDIGQRRDTLGETQSRRGTAERIYLDILKRGDEAIGDLNPEDVDTHIAAREEQLRNALAYAREWGGLRESPEIGYEGFPAVQQIRQTSLAGLSAPSGPEGPRIFDPRVPGPPPAGAPVAPPAEMAPAFRPPPPVAAAAPAGPSMAVPAINPIDQSPIVLPSQLPQPAPPISEQARDTEYRFGPGGAPPSHWQQAGEPVQVPNEAPGVTVPYPSDAALQSKISPRWMQETRYGEGTYFDPDLAGQQLSMELDIDPEIMKQAIAALYG